MRAISVWLLAREVYNDSVTAMAELLTPRDHPSHVSRVARALFLAGLISSLVVATVATGQSTARSTYPFLDSAPLRAPDIFYIPRSFPPEMSSLGLTFGTKGAGTELEIRLGAPDGQVVIWESTRVNAKVEEAAGSYQDDGEIRGALGSWHMGHTADGSRLLYARVGTTLVVITGAHPIEELLRIADSLRRGSPSSLML